MKKKILCALAMTLVISSTTVFGAVKEGGLSISPLIGGYIYDNDQQFNANVLLGIRGGYSITRALGIEGVYDYIAATDSKYWALKDISMHRFGGQALYHFMPDNQLVPYLAAGFSGVKFNGSGVNSQIHSSFDYGAGAKYFLTDDIALRADLRHLLYAYNNKNYNNVELMLGATFQFGGTTPVVRVAAPGSALESAPFSPEEHMRTVAASAPVAEPVKSPPLPKPIICPPAFETVKTVIAPASREACEPFLVAVIAKASPEASTAKACTVPADITVLFSYERHDVKQQYYDELDKIGNFLKSYPNAKVTIEGHTSAMGDKDADLKLSQVRAGNVKSHLMYKFSIDASRITAEGYGLTRPVASNKTTRGRMQNRRIVAVFNCE